MKGMSMKCLLLLAGLAYSLMAAAPANLFTNGGFEGSYADGGADFGWPFELNSDSGAQATRVIDSMTGTAKEGKSFCRINVTAVSKQNNWHVQMKDPAWAAKKDSVYHFSIWARSDSTRTATISVYGDASSIYTWRASATMNLTTEWQQFHQIFTADVEGTNKINFALVCGSQIGVYDFDAAMLITSPPPDTNNIYQNGSFEVDGAGWNLWVKTDSSSTGAATMGFPTAGAKSGEKFCRVDVTSKPESAFEVQLQDPSWKCQKCFTYTFRAWAKADSARAISIEAQAGSTREYAGLTSMEFPLSTEWQACSLSYTSIDLAGTDSLSFSIFCGASTGKYDFDFISLIGVFDTTCDTVHVHPVIGNPVKSARQYAIHVAPEHLHCTMADAMITPFKVDIFSVQGRILSTHAIFTAGRSFDLPRPPSGMWIVRVGSKRSNVVIVP